MFLKSKLNGKNKITAINAWAVAIFRIRSRNVKIKKNNDNVWSVTPEE